MNYILKSSTFYIQYMKLKYYFDTEINHHNYYADWTHLIFTDFRNKIPDRPLQKVLHLFINRKLLCERALDNMYAGESLLRTQIITSSRKALEPVAAFFNPGASCEELFSRLRATLEMFTMKKARRRESQSQFQQQFDNNQFFLDLRYNSNKI